ncbi:hypothetical protein PRIEUP_LOCUS6514, partial [Pristimantis euphronides]
MSPPSSVQMSPPPSVRMSPPPSVRMSPPPSVRMSPPPSDCSSFQLYATVQKEQQKKKRRAPPPPPTPPMPNENYEDFEHSKSSTGNGRQVPQKPPRGNSRSAPQFMIPPPPPCPPPEPPVFENGATLTGPPRPIPAKREKRLLRFKHVSSKEVLTTDDTGSVNSYTEDSGIVSSPSDSTSLDLQNYCSKREEETETQVDECKSSIDHMQPARVESFNSEDSWSLNTSNLRADNEVAVVKNGDEENFITEQFQQTLAELDEDSEDLDDGDIGESRHIETRSSPVGEESSHYNDSSEHSAAVPVTVIDQVPEMNILKYCPHKVTPVKEYNKMQECFAIGTSQSIVVLPEVDKQKNENITYKTHQSISQEEKSKYVENHYVSNTSINNSSINTPQKQYTIKESLSSNIAIPAPSINVSQETRPVKERTDIMPEHNKKIEIKGNRASNNVYKTTESTKPVLWRHQTYEPKVGMTTFTVVPPKPDVKKYDREVSLSASAIKIDDLGNLISPQSSFDKNISKNTFINDTEGPLVEKPLLEKAKEFWRSNSMESQTVEHIGSVSGKDETVKKLAPVKSYKSNQAPDSKVKTIPFMPLTQQTPGNKLNDTEKQMPPIKSALLSAASQDKILIENTSKGRDKVSFVRPTVHSKFNGTQQTKPAKSPDENMTIIESTIRGKMDLQTAVNYRPVGSQQNKPVQLSTASQEKVIIIEQPNKERKDLLFLNPSKRTSSQYVASAISKYVEPVNKKSIQPSEANLDASLDNRNNTLKSNGNFIQQEPKVEVKAMNKQDISVDFKKNFSNSDGQVINTKVQVEPTTKINSACEQVVVERPISLSEQNGFNGSQTILGSTTAAKRTNLNSTAPAESSHVSRLPSNAFLRAVREKSAKVEQANSIVPTRSAPATVVSPENGEKHNTDIIPFTVIDEPDSPSSSNVFGTKARFRPVVQRPMQKDNSLHSTLMGAIQSGEGKEKLRKIQSSPTDGGKEKFAEPENERSALLSAIRAHNGISRLKKVSSAASDELQTLRSKEMVQKNNDFVTMKTSIPSPPFSPPPPLPPVLYEAPKSRPVSLNSSLDAREALLDAIRSGAGASRLKKVQMYIKFT